MTFNLDRFCVICDMDLEMQDAFLHISYEHKYELFNAIFNVLTPEQQKRILDQLVNVRPKK